MCKSQTKIMTSNELLLTELSFSESQVRIIKTCACKLCFFLRDKTRPRRRKPGRKTETNQCRRPSRVLPLFLLFFYISSQQHIITYLLKIKIKIKGSCFLLHLLFLKSPFSIYKFSHPFFIPTPTLSSLLFY